MPGIDPVTAILNIGQAAIKRIWPDPAKQAEEQRRLAELAQSGDIAYLQAEVQLLVAQLEVNKAEAQHKSVFVAGWRPGIGWVGVAALAYQFVLYPLLLWAFAYLAAKGDLPEGFEPPPVIDSDALFVMVTGMLGIGGMRSWDKRNGTQTDKI